MYYMIGPQFLVIQCALNVWRKVTSSLQTTIQLSHLYPTFIPNHRNKRKTMVSDMGYSITSYWNDLAQSYASQKSWIFLIQSCKSTHAEERHFLTIFYSKALASILRYLEEFGLEHALQLTKYFVHFSSRTHMLLNGNTLANLEIYRNSTDFTEKGSLFWILNHTKTRFGKRLLRKWVGRPLVDVQ